MARHDGDRICRDWDPGRPAAGDETAVVAHEMTQAWDGRPAPGVDPPRRPPPAGDETMVAPPAPGPEPTVARPRPAAPGQPAAGSSALIEPMAAFTIHPPGDPASHDFGATRGLFDTPRPPASGGEPARDEPFAFPQAGDGIGGFRLVSELGRGAFGRVFLAEESLLGNRLVALKITRAEGDEPRILARLQHTHIVPIHSVHDDPKAGLRLMCMPYVGGANLAQVLEAAAAARGAEGDSRSLLRALDIVGMPPPSEATCPGGSRRRRSSAAAPSLAGASQRPRSGLFGLPSLASRSHPAAAPPPPAPPPSHVSLEVADPDPAADLDRAGGRWALLSQFPRWSRSIAQAHRSWPRHRPEAGNDRDPIQPARRFLREADFVRSAAWIIARLAEGLEHAHAHGLLHRDLKPSNILIAADGTPMLLDFNLAADTTVKASEADHGRMGGTLPYMAPEHLDAFHPEGTTPPEAVDERSDIYALGLILFEMIAGRRPFPEPDPDRTILEVIRTMHGLRLAGAPALRSVHPGVPRDLDAVVRKALHADPDRRHARAGDFAEDLRRFLDDQPLKYTAEPTLRGRAAKWIRRNPRATGASTVGLVGLALVIGLSATAWSVNRHLTQVSARLRLKGFEARFPECQFLLNTVGGPVESLGKGITLAEETLEQAGIAVDLDRGGGAAGRGWLDVLPEAERAEVRKDLAEVILLLARARVFLADRTHSAADQRRAVDRAIAWLDRAERVDPTPNLTLYDDRSRYLARIGATQRAAADRRRRDAIAPSTGRDFYLLGASLLARHQPDRAEAALIKATSLNPQGFWPWFALGLCHFDQQRFADSAGDFAVCTVLSPRFAWPWINRGLALAKDNRLVEARAAYDRAVAADPTRGDSLGNRGLVALELDDLPAAVADLERAIRLGHRDVDVEAALGEALGRAGRTDEALLLLDGLVARHPTAALPRVARGTLRLAADPAAAEADFRAILAASPRDPGAFLGLARLKRLDDPRAALDYASRALEGEPNRVDIIELRAWIRGSLGDPAVVADVDRLARTPTAGRLYNAACALALYVRQHPDPALADRAVGYLRRSIQWGIDAARIRDDPDLADLRGDPAFRALVAPRPASGPAGDR